MIQTDAIIHAIRRITDGTVLSTPSGAEFFVEAVKPTRIILRIGKKQQRLVIDFSCISEIVKEFKFIPPGKWLRIGTTISDPKPGTLEAICKQHSGGKSSASYLAAILEHVGAADVDRGRPARIRLL